MGKGKFYIDFLEKFVSERSFKKLCSKMWNWKLGSLFFLKMKNYVLLLIHKIRNIISEH